MSYYNKKYRKYSYDLSDTYLNPITYSGVSSFSNAQYSSIAMNGSSGSTNALASRALSGVSIPNFNNFIQHGVCNVPSGTLGVYSPQVVRVRKTKVKPVTTFDSSYRKLYGMPVNKVISLSGISGYTQLTDFHLEGSNFATCTSDELNALDSLLRGGIIL